MSEQQKKRATIDQAKAAWEAHPDPSIRTVCEVLGRNGLVCSIATIQRWHKTGWVLKGKTRLAAKISQEATAAVKASVERQDDKTLTRLDIIQAEEAEMKARAVELEKVENDSELARKAMRKSLIAQIVLAEQIIRRAVFLVECAPKDASKILEALKGPAASTTIVIPPREVQQGQNGDGARVVNGHAIHEESPSQLAIAAFKQRQKQGFAA